MQQEASIVFGSALGHWILSLVIVGFFPFVIIHGDFLLSLFFLTLLLAKAFCLAVSPGHHGWLDLLDSQYFLLNTGGYERWGGGGIDFDAAHFHHLGYWAAVEWAQRQILSRGEDLGREGQTWVLCLHPGWAYGDPSGPGLLSVQFQMLTSCRICLESF